MIILFAVVWELVSCYSMPCPDYKPDAYGRMPAIHCDVLHMKCDTFKKEKLFTTKQQAEEFIKEAGVVEVQFLSIGDQVRNFKIEERP